MNCKNCGISLPDDAKFCSSCGSPVEVQSDAQPENSAVQQTPVREVPVQQPAVSQQTPEQSSNQKPENSTLTEEQKPAPEVAVAPVKKKGSLFLKTFLSIICSIFIFALSLSAITVISLRESIDSDSVSEIVDSVDVQSILDSTDISESLMKELSDSDVKRIYSKSTFKNYVESTVNDYADYILTGSLPDGIKTEDITNLMDENKEIIEKEIGRSLTQIDYDEVTEYFDENGEVVLGALSSEVRTNTALDLVKNILSTFTLVAVLIVLALFIFLLFLARKGSISSLVWIASCFILSAVVFGAVSTIRPIIMSFIPSSNAIVSDLAGLYLRSTFDIFLRNSAIVALTGGLLIAIYSTVRAIAKSRKKSVAA